MTQANQSKPADAGANETQLATPSPANTLLDESPLRNKSPMDRSARSLINFLLQCGLLSAAIYMIAIWLWNESWPANWQRVVLTSILVCNIATVPPILLTWSQTHGRSGVTSALLTTTWRLATLIAVVMLWTATKWLPSEFNAKCLVGCYFPFLILESWHSIRKTNHRI